MLWLVTANVHDNQWGEYIYCFGVANCDTSLERIKNKVIELGFTPKVTEVETDIIIPFNGDYQSTYLLGGYAE